MRFFISYKDNKERRSDNFAISFVALN